MIRLAVAMSALAVGLAACVAPDEGFDGRLAYAEDCAACHGNSGQGNGPEGALLAPAPADLTVLSASNGGVFPRDAVLSTIDGYLRGDRFGAAMPEFGARDQGPTVVVEGEDGLGTPIPARLLALVEYLETIQR